MSGVDILNSMNIHPIFVHFPVALLTVYAILELIRPKKLLASHAYTAIKAFLVILGTLAAYVAAETGDMASELMRGQSSVRTILRLHENFAAWTQIIFTVIAASYIVVLISRRWKRIPVITAVAEFIQRGPVIIVLALGGLVFVTLTGALGGLIVYGPTADPVMSLVANLFSLQ